ncbi:MAG: ABC transporter substrate-binding protein [Actinobacteria bacterium]|nr:ABC transporter substrate-binding protein [Actinomycetota bacterium]
MRRTSTTRARTACITVSAAALVLGLAACGGSSTAEPSAAAPAASAPAAAAGVDAAAVALLPAGIADDGALTVGMEVAYPPFGYKDTDNVTPIGFDVDLATEMANRLGLKLVIVDAAFDSIIPSLASNRYEAGVSAFSITPERQKEVDFVTYFQSGDSALVLTGNPKGLSLDTKLCGVKTAVLKGSTQEVVTVPAIDADCKAGGLAPIEVLSLGGSEELPLALQSGRADVALADSGNAAYVAQNSAGAFEIAVGPLINSGPGGMVFKKGGGMAEAVSAALQGLMDDGTYGAIADKWGLSSGKVTTATINEAKG